MSVTIQMTLDGVTRSLKWKSMYLTEARECQRLTGMTKDQFEEAFFEGRADAVAFAWWLACKRAGEPLPGSFADLDFDMGAMLYEVLADDGTPVVAEEADPDFPTGPNPDTATDPI